MLLIEWAISSCPFIYWATIYHEWVFMADVIVFFISQQVREKKNSCVSCLICNLTHVGKFTCFFIFLCTL
jgi:hypothetical protein